MTSLPVPLPVKCKFKIQYSIFLLHHRIRREILGIRRETPLKLFFDWTSSTGGILDLDPFANFSAKSKRNC